MAILSGWDKDSSPFHQGEQKLQDRIGLKERQEALGMRIIRPYMPDQHREFFEQLPYMIIGSVDADGWPWASIVFGQPGFVQTPNDKTMSLAANPLAGDPLSDNFEVGAPLSFLGIEMATRRRNRVNGILTDIWPIGFTAKVVHSFGNCPKYIDMRDVEFVRDPRELHNEGGVERFTQIDEGLQNFIRKATLCFVASYNNLDDESDTGGVDVNHRGGPEGFIRVEGNQLTIPDYHGNNLFNTLGNFIVNPKAGLLFIDFETQDLILLTGTTEIFWSDDPVVQNLPDVGRAWRFTLNHGIRLKQASPILWTSQHN